MKPIWEKLGKLMSVNGLNAFIASNIQAFNGEMGISNYEEIHFSKGVLKVPMARSGHEREPRWTCVGIRDGRLRLMPVRIGFVQG